MGNASPNPANPATVLSDGNTASEVFVLAEPATDVADGESAEPSLGDGFLRDE